MKEGGEEQRGDGGGEGEERGGERGEQERGDEGGLSFRARAGTRASGRQKCRKFPTCNGREEGRECG